MNKKAWTLEEKFMIACKQQADILPDIQDFFDPTRVAISLGVKEKSLKNILQKLFQVNFLRKKSQQEVSLTKQGLTFVYSLLDE